MINDKAGLGGGAAPSAGEPAGDGGADWSTRFFESDEEMNEVAVGLAISGMTLDQALADLKSFYGSREERLKGSYGVKLAELEAESGATEAALKRAEATIEQKQEEAAALTAERRETDQRIQALEIEQHEAWQQIRQRRFEHGKEFFTDQKGQLATELTATRAEILAAVQHKLDRDEKIYQVEKKYRDTNDAEFARRAKFWDDEKEAVEEQLAEAEKWAARLKRVGVTRTTATFLFVAGYVSLAGVGGVIASLIQGRQPTEDVISRLTFNVISALDKTVPAGWEAWGVVLKPLTLLLLLPTFFLFFYALVWINDRLVSWFDPSWRSDQKEMRGSAGQSRRRERLQDQFAGLTTQFMTLKSQLSNFTSFDIDRRDYTRLLASFPYVFLGAIIVFLFSGVDKDGKLLTLTTASIGIVFAIASTIGALLYVTRYVKPRWVAEAGGEEGEAHTLPRFLRTNWELATLMGLMVLALVLAAALPTVDSLPPYFSAYQLKLNAWGGVALFMCASGSFGLAYGIIQRGIFRDVGYLKNQRNKLSTLIEEYTFSPVMGENNYGLLQEVEDPTPRFLRARRWLDKVRTAYEMNEVFGDDFDLDGAPPQEGSARWQITNAALSLDKPERPAETGGRKSRWPFSGRRAKEPSKRRLWPFFNLRLKQSPPAEPRGVDFLVAPEQARAFLTTRSEIARAYARAGELDRKVQELDREIATLRARIRDLLSEIADLRARYTAHSRARERQLNSLSTVRDRELMKFRAAFAIGAVARELLEGEGILLEDEVVTDAGDLIRRELLERVAQEVGGRAGRPAATTPSGTSVAVEGAGAAHGPSAGGGGLPDSPEEKKDE